MCRLLRVPSSLAKVFRPLPGQFHWNHGTSFRLLVLAMAVMWGRRNVAHVSRYLDAAPHRTRFNHFFLVERWAPEAARRQQAQVLVRGLPPGKGELRSLMRDDAKKAKRGQGMEAVAQRNDSVTAASSRGHQDVGAMVVCRTQVLPWGIPL